MASEPFRYDQNMLDVSDMNMTSGLRNSLNPLAHTHRLALSSDLPSSLDHLGRSSDGATAFLGADSFLGSSPALMTAHQKAENQRNMQSPLTAAMGANGLPATMATGSAPGLALFNGQSGRGAHAQGANMEGNAGGRVAESFMSMSSRPPSNHGPAPVIQVPQSLQSSGPTLDELKAAGATPEVLSAMQSAVMQSPQPTTPFAAYLQAQTPNSTTPGASSGTPGITNSGSQLRFSGDRYASSAFSPVSPGGSSTGPKPGMHQYTPSTTPGAQVLPPPSQLSSAGTSAAASPNAAAFGALGSPTTSISSPNAYSTGSYSQGLESLAHTSEMMSAGSYGANGAAPPHKRPYMGPVGGNAPHMTQLPPGYRVPDAMSDDSSRTTPNGAMPMFPDDARSHTLLTSLQAFSQGMGLAANVVKQENMIQEHMLGQGVLAGPASAAFTYQGKAIPYSEEAARQHYMMREEAKKAELGHIQSHLARLKRTEALANGTDDNFLSESYLEHRRIKKLHPLTYDALYRAIVANIDGSREKYMLNEHPHVDSLADLPGRIYFLQVAKGSRKPPHVGFPFRSYSDSHYTSVDRENPVICKVKEWPVDNDPKNIWRLYHYYLGNKKRAPRKRKRADDSDGD